MLAFYVNFRQNFSLHAHRSDVGWSAACVLESNKSLPWTNLTHYNLCFRGKIYTSKVKNTHYTQYNYIHSKSSTVERRKNPKKRFRISTEINFRIQMFVKCNCNVMLDFNRNLLLLWHHSSKSNLGLHNHPPPFPLSLVIDVYRFILSKLSASLAIASIHRLPTGLLPCLLYTSRCV